MELRLERKTIAIIYFGFIFAFSSLFAFAQLPTPTATPAVPSEVSTPAKAANPGKPGQRLIFDALLLGSRFHYNRNANGRVTADNLQWQFGVRAHFSFDREGRYAVHGALLSGNSIVAGWNNSGIGTGRYVTNLYLKQLYFDAKPVTGLEVKIGGFAPDNGENTEATGYDNDTYMMGERITVKLPKKLYFDEISATNGFIGDLLVPNIFRRFGRMGSSNYHQFMVKKRLNKSVAFSADYSFDSGVDTLRQGMRVTIPKSRILDIFQFEIYERIDPKPGYGLNAYVQKKLQKHFSLGGGYARIDGTRINADRFARGNRVYMNGIVTLNKEFSVTTAFTQGIGPIQPVLSRTRLDIAFAYNVLETIRRKKTH